MQASKKSEIIGKKAKFCARGGGLVRLERRDLGLGEAGLAVVRALVVSGWSWGGGAAPRRAAAGQGEGGGSRCARGGGGAMGLGWRSLV